ncbi:hypothetical protein SAMN04488567_2901 [Limimaricola pyoseonensis]|uniref:Uncharacterized protein n=1 Tax=Limimaricola pyoseonensis TaxID=521013 RepID=A0A1G7GS25_9RHOB|nr:hypothetical protein SAMN04488567_2901 [Limimaricola pyoseonensis]
MSEPCRCLPCLCADEVARLESGIELALGTLQSGRAADAETILADLVDGTDPKVEAVRDALRRRLIEQWHQTYGPRQPFLEWAHARRGAA